MEGYYTSNYQNSRGVANISNSLPPVILPKVGDKILLQIGPYQTMILGTGILPIGQEVVEVEVKSIKKATLKLE